MSTYLIVDESRKFELDQKPSVREGLKKSGVVIIDIVDINSLGKRAKYKDKRMDTLMPISTKNVNNHLLMKNNLYKNCFTPILDFSEMYHSDIKRKMIFIAKKMGAVSLQFFRHEEEKQSFWSRLTGSVFGTMRGNQLSVKGSQENEEKNQCLTKEQEGYETEDEIEKQKIREKRMSKEELQKWLNDEEIDLSAFPDVFASMVDDYLRTGECYGKYGKKEEIHILKEVKKCCEMQEELIANTPSFAAECRINVEKKEKQEQEKYQKISFEIKF